MQLHQWSELNSLPRYAYIVLMPKNKHKYRPPESDGVYLFKLVLYLVLGAQWLWLETSAGARIPLPLGLVIGVGFAWKDHFQLDRKIEYAVLLVAMMLGFIGHIGIYMSL